MRDRGHRRVGDQVLAGRKKILVRRAGRPDAPGILQCLRAAFAPFEESYTPQAFEDTVLSEATLEQRMASLSLWVAVDEVGDIIGTLGCGVVNQAEAHLRGMAVIPGWQGRGVAEKLLEAVEREFVEKGCSRFTLDTTEPLARARRFYEKHGFRPTGVVTDLFGMPLTEQAKTLKLRTGKRS